MSNNFILHIYIYKVLDVEARFANRNNMINNFFILFFKSLQLKRVGCEKPMPWRFFSS